MAKVISTINLKGGVGKTQLTVAMAEFLASEYGKKVLVIDLDPQTNATVALMDQDIWFQKDQEGGTLRQLFKDKLDKTSIFDVEKAIVKGVSNVGGGIRRLHLLPSSLGLIELQDSLALIPAGRFHFGSPVTILKEAVSPVLDQYDFVLMDCPPNLGIITLNGIYISDYYLIPCIPDILSTYGIPQIISRVEGFKAEAHIEIEPLGIVVSMFRSQSRLHSSVLQTLRTKASQGEYPRVFETVIPLTVKVAEAADYETKVNTLKQKYGYGTIYTDFERLVEEVLRYVA
ncbi:MAG: AAA family ATPase [Bacillota bacterium]